MPLKKGYSEKTIKENIKIEEKHGKSHEQAIAIALASAQKYKEEELKRKHKKHG